MTGKDIIFKVPEGSKQIPGYENYIITPTGEIYKQWANCTYKKMKTLLYYGSLRICLTRKHKRDSFALDKLVKLVFGKEEIKKPIEQILLKKYNPPDKIEYEIGDKLNITRSDSLNYKIQIVSKLWKSDDKTVKCMGLLLEDTEYLSKGNIYPMALYTYDCHTNINLEKIL